MLCLLFVCCYAGEHTRSRCRDDQQPAALAMRRATPTVHCSTWPTVVALFRTSAATSVPPTTATTTTTRMAPARRSCFPSRRRGWGTTAIAAATRPRYFAEGTPPATRPAPRALPQPHVQRRGHSPNPRLKGWQGGQWFATAGSAGAAGATCGGGGFTGQSWGLAPRTARASVCHAASSPDMGHPPEGGRGRISTASAAAID